MSKVMDNLKINITKVHFRIEETVGS